VNENTTIKHAEIVLRRGAEGMSEKDGEVNLIKIYCKHIYKYHNVFPLYNYYMKIKYFLKKIKPR
jgi:hypothetical protein